MNNNQVAEYIEEISSELSALADRSGYEMLGYYLALAAAEAFEIVQNADSNEDSAGRQLAKSQQAFRQARK